MLTASTKCPARREFRGSRKKFRHGKSTKELRQYLQRVADETEFQKWYFGHFHEDAEVEEVFVCLYDEVVEVS